MLADKALLVQLTISQWTGRKLDKRATSTVEQVHATQAGVGNYTKKLLPGAKELEEVQRIASSIRQFVYENTLSWNVEGQRLLSIKAYLTFRTQFRIKKGEFDGAVARFIQEYPVLREEARAKLGALFSEGEYPTVERLADRFQCDVDVWPVPDTSHWLVDPTAADKQDLEQRLQAREAQAKRECCDKLREVVSTAAAVLNKPGKIFRDSLIENVVNMCNAIDSLNVTNDPQIDAIRQGVESICKNISVEQCRESDNVRSDAAAKLDEAVAKMSAFMGAVS